MFLIHLDLLNLVMVHIFTKSKNLKILLKQGLTFKCDHLLCSSFRSGGELPSVASLNGSAFLFPARINYE